MLYYVKIDTEFKLHYPTKMNPFILPLHRVLYF